MTKYAVIDTDGTRLVYWGMGDTEELARADAAGQEGYAETEHNACVEISDMLAARIEAGDVEVR